VVIESCFVVPLEVGFTKQEVLAQARQRGSKVTEAQLDRWRDADLVPVVRTWPKAGHGSAALYPAIAVEIVLAIECALLRWRNLERVGWELWWLGYPVPERYWIPILERATLLIRRFSKFVSRLLKRRDSDDALSDRISRTPQFAQVLPKPLRRHAQNMVNNGDTELLITAEWLLAESFAGEFDGFGWDNAAHGEARENARGVATLLGLAKAQMDQVLGVGLNVEDALPIAMRALARIQRIPDGGISGNRSYVADLLPARNDIRNAMDSVRDLHEACAWVWGRGAFGLGIINWLAENAAPIVRAIMILGWSEMRPSGNFLSSEEMAGMREEARNTSQASRALKAAAGIRPELANILTPQRLCRAMSDEHEMKKLANKIEQMRRT
jgi:hypothetical protein